MPRVVTAQRASCASAGSKWFLICKLIALAQQTGDIGIDKLLANPRACAAPALSTRRTPRREGRPFMRRRGRPLPCDSGPVLAALRLPDLSFGPTPDMVRPLRLVYCGVARADPETACARVLAHAL